MSLYTEQEEIEMEIDSLYQEIEQQHMTMMGMSNPMKIKRRKKLIRKIEIQILELKNKL